jgi:hypothetical protein
MLGILHLVTFGWITASILGFSLYVVGPIALRAEFRQAGSTIRHSRSSSTAIVGMVAHFWLLEVRRHGVVRADPHRDAVGVRGRRSFAFVGRSAYRRSPGRPSHSDAVPLLSARRWCLLAATILDSASAIQILRIALSRGDRGVAGRGRCRNRGGHLSVEDAFRPT